ncbi:MAG: chitobiase/beta-hexosaminidase C-terminal domain-containing protein [Butyrivibrio sp.]
MNLNVQLKKIIAVVLVLSLAVAVFPVTAKAENSSVQFIDESGADATCSDYTFVTNQIELGTENVTTWYVVKETVNIADRMTILGDVNLIISDGVTMNANLAINIPDGSSLTIYGQEEQTGKLYVPNQSSGWRNGICLNTSGSVTLNGGILDASGAWNGEAAIGGGPYGAEGGKTTVNRGQLIVTGGNSSALTTKLIINGGTVLAQTAGSNRTITGSITVNRGTLKAVNTQDGGFAFSVIPVIATGMKMISGDSSNNSSICNSADRNTSIRSGQKYICITDCDSHCYNDVSTCIYCNYIGVTSPISSLSSGTYCGQQIISLSTDEENNLIYYTTDGSEPTTDSMLYTDSITLEEVENETKNITIKAIAVNPDIGKSSVSKFTYTIIPEQIILTNEQKSKIIMNAEAAIGCGYVYGMAGPKVFDDTGLVYYAFKQTNITVPRQREQLENYIQNSSVAIECTTKENISENERFQTNPEPGDIVMFSVKQPDESISTLFGVYEKREDGIDYVIAVFTPSSVVHIASIKDWISELQTRSYEVISVSVYKINNSDDIEIDSVELENDISGGQPLITEIPCETTGVDRIIVEWTDSEGNEVSGNADTSPRQYKMHMTVIPERGYIFTDESQIVLNAGNDVVETNLNEDGTLTGTATIYPVEYEIIQEEQLNWTQGSDEGLTIIGNGDFQKFVGVNVDDNLLDSIHYDAKSGSTIITIKPEFLSTLSAGLHTIEIVWTDGSASSTFQIENDGSENDGPENDGPENNGPENNGPENNGPENNGPENNGPENNDPSAGDLTSATLPLILLIISGIAFIFVDKKYCRQN